MGQLPDSPPLDDPYNGSHDHNPGPHLGRVVPQFPLARSLVEGAWSYLSLIVNVVVVVRGLGGIRDCGAFGVDEVVAIQSGVGGQLAEQLAHAGFALAALAPPHAAEAKRDPAGLGGVVISGVRRLLVRGGLAAAGAGIRLGLGPLTCASWVRCRLAAAWTRTRWNTAAWCSAQTTPTPYAPRTTWPSNCAHPMVLRQPLNRDGVRTSEGGTDIAPWPAWGAAMVQESLS
jgi:hypothetical protein